MTIKEYLSRLSKENPEAIIVGSLGNINNALKELDHPHKVHMRGAMGHTMGCALGIALNTDKQVFAIVGEGSFLMKLGSMATLVRFALPNLRVIILDNGCYASCGGQQNYFHAIRNLLPFEIIRVQ